jgi:putative sugar O-methyltransferase
MLFERSVHFVRKVWQASRGGTLFTRGRRYLVRSVRDPLSVTLDYLRLPSGDRALDVEDGFADHRAAPEHGRADPRHLARLVAAYRASKIEGAHAAAPFQVRGMWKEWVDVNYHKLGAALDRGDLAGLGALLENYSREDFAAGFGGGHIEHRHYRNSPFARFYIQSVWAAHRDRLAATGFDLREVHAPFVGNPAGLRLNGEVITVDTFRHVHHAREMLDLVRDVERPTIVEIGGGDGGQAYQAVRLAGTKRVRYLVFDLPEIAVVSAFLLLSSLPDKKVVLYGEPGADELAQGDFDVAVLPHFAAGRLPPRSVDVFFNSCSFGEMDSASSREYLRIAESACRGWFLHINHDTRFEYRSPDGSVSRNVLGSELVPDQRFRRIYKKPRIFSLPEDRDAPSCEYLYRRTADSTV